MRPPMTTSTEQVRIKVFQDRVLIGVIGRSTYMSWGAMYDWFGDGERADSLAAMVGFPTRSKVYLDGLRNPYMVEYTL